MQLPYTHLEWVQHCTDLPHQITLPAHTEQRKINTGVGKSLPLVRSRRERRCRKRKQQKSNRKKDRRSILERIRVALLRSVRENHNKKVFGVGRARNNWDLREGQQPLRFEPAARGPHHNIQVALLRAFLMYLCNHDSDMI